MKNEEVYKGNSKSRWLWIKAIILVAINNASGVLMLYSLNIKNIVEFNIVDFAFNIFSLKTPLEFYFYGAIWCTTFMLCVTAVRLQIKT